MPTIAWISAATVAGGVISIAIAAMFALSAPASWVPALVSFAIGTLLGAVFLEILPHAIGSAGNLQALFAAAFLQSTELGVVTAAAIIAHEIPQEIGDFVILLHSGYSKQAALALNLLSSLAMLVGALLAYFTLQAAQEWIGTVLALAAASMIYVAVADLIPGLHRRPELRATAQQVVLIALGVALIWLVGDLAAPG